MNDATAYDLSDSLFTIKDISDVKEDDIPEAYELFYNYPNPFNPFTIIGYEVSERSLITLKIYDILGKKIATLVNEENSAGEYEVEFNAASHSGNVLVSTKRDLFLSVEVKSVC
ncbi:MAG: hypothetical protein U5J96_01475 [Ignavibacteriaceae bacterium]|nr:hypothetical protein [Ignavibacteriaceae bacterium]